MKINFDKFIALWGVTKRPDDFFKAPIVPPGVVPKEDRIEVDGLAKDSVSYLNQSYGPQLFGLSGTFMGFAGLAQLSQQGEFRMISEKLAKEVTRRWIKFNSSNKGDEKIKAIESAFKKFAIKKLICTMAEQDGFFGRAQLFVDMGVADADLAEPLLRDKRTIAQGSVKGFRTVEAYWTYPGIYNSTNPLATNFYRPDYWYVMGKRVHRDRLLTLITRPVADILKAVYSFGGLPLSQMCEPYVNNWLRTRNSVSDLLHSFSLTILKTSMGDTLQGGAGDNLFQRAAMFNAMRDTKGLMIVDKESEEITQINTPLSGLDSLQAQSQEHIASISSIPLVKLLGTSPSGLNASTEGELTAFYDWIASMQQDDYGPIVQAVFEIVQLHLFGEIDPAISFEWVPMQQPDEEKQTRIRLSDAQADQIYLDAGVVGPDEVRKKVGNDPNSGYDGLDVEDMPEMPTSDEDDPDDKPE